ncbi:MAG: Fe-S cluster assembly protein SufD [Verrucomicrobia bacterium]|nr:Fe-S cluster assembly protein SufD [Pseudomonadota bacterium]NBS06703.1 Fe-S cluster assembly protein SufD [Verrucomicrobiota bacterium]NBS49804.1 Fe-S cluster assembly protein SufD [Verrucomicrobiota bacterium]NBT23984.1 Fe-S cluster assembly protein SufD [bacterium]NBY66901.1 Fe-S cluster assembly protein SufD [Verrucomicrobiota bacterium]
MADRSGQTPLNPSGLTGPAWWEERKAAAWKKFQALPMPRRNEEDWRFATIDAIQLGDFRPGQKGSTSKEALLKRSSASFSHAAKAVFSNDRLLHIEGGEELAKQGVVFESLAGALERHPGLLEKHFMAHPVDLGAQKFAALHAAHASAGVLIHVPKGVEVKHPLITHHWLDGDASAVFPHTLIVAGENAKVTVVDHLGSTQGNGRGLACGVTDLLVGAGAKVDLVCFQTWGSGVTSFQLNSTRVERNGEARSLFVNLGAAYARQESRSTMVGEGARSEMLGLSVGCDRQEFDQRTLQCHDVPNTWSDLLYKNALDDRSKSIFKGLIRVAPGAAKTDAYQNNRNLLLNPEAEADSMPGLEILNDDVRCTHGATTGQIDRDQLFYLMARGIDPRTGAQLLAHGFFEEVIARLPDREIGEAARALVATKFLSMRTRGGEAKQAAAVKRSGDHVLPEDEILDVRALQGLGN